MLEIKNAQSDPAVNRLLENLQETYNRSKLALETMTAHPHLNLEQILRLEPNGISMHYLLEQLGLL